MTCSLRSIRALAAAATCAAMLSACGGDGIPSNAVAVVGKTPITLTTLNHWLAISAGSTLGSTAHVTKGPPLVPPHFTACIAELRATGSKPAKGQAPPSTASLLTQCERNYAGAVNQVMFFLITAVWFQDEAAADGIKVSAASTRAQLERDTAATVAQGTFPDVAALNRYMVSIGETTQDQLYHVRTQLLSEALDKRALVGTPPVTPAEIAAYYKANKASLRKAETRTLRVVLVKTRATGERVVALLKAGASFAEVVRQFSVDSQTKSKAGLLENQTQTGSSLDKAFAAAAFRAPPQVVEGPVKTARGYEVFRVEKIVKAHPATLHEASPVISSALALQHRTATSQAFVQRFYTKWLFLTTCRPAYAVSTNPAVCRNSATAPQSAATGATG